MCVQCVSVHVYVCLYVCVCACVCVHVYTLCVHAHVCVCVCVCICVALKLISKTIEQLLKRSGWLSYASLYAQMYISPTQCKHARLITSIRQIEKTSPYVVSTFHYINQTIRHPPHTRAVEFASPRRNNEHFCSM